MSLNLDTACVDTLDGDVAGFESEEGCSFVLQLGFHVRYMAKMRRRKGLVHGRDRISCRSCVWRSVR